MAKMLSAGLGAFVAVFASTAARSEDLWGCEVALCMASPVGPTAAPACRPPMERLARQLRKGRPFPRCPQASTAPAQPAVEAEGPLRVADP
jgi:hypothetical protein